MEYRQRHEGGGEDGLSTAVYPGGQQVDGQQRSQVGQGGYRPAKAAEVVDVYAGYGRRRYLGQLKCV